MKCGRKYLFTAGILAGLVSANAAERKWTGATGDQLWSTPGNWTGDAVPTAEDDVDVPASTEIVVTRFQEAGALVNRGSIHIVSLPRRFPDPEGGALKLRTGSNHGRILLTSEGTDQGSELNIEGTFTNEPNGRIEAEFALPVRFPTIAGHLINRGLVTSKDGILQIGSGAIYEMWGGTLGEHVRVKDSEIRLLERAPGNSSLRLWGQNTIATAVPAGVELSLEATGENSANSILSATNLVNEGRIILKPIDEHHRSELRVAGTFRNARGGEIQTLATAGTGNAMVDANLLNEGLVRLGTFTQIGAKNTSSNRGSIEIQPNVTAAFTGDRWINESPGLLEGAGTLQVDNTRFLNQGQIRVRAKGDTFAIEGFLEQLAGSTELNDGRLRVTKGAIVRGGVLVGPGIVDGSVTNSAKVRTGIAPGNLVITKQYVERPGAKLQWTLTGPEAGTRFVPLHVQEQAILFGTREFTLAGFQPATNTVLEIARFHSASHPSQCFLTRIDAGGFVLEEKWEAQRLLLTTRPYQPQDVPRVSIELCPDTAVRLEIEGLPLTQYSLQASTNLIHWAPMASVSSTTGYIQYTDETAPAFTSRYYRVREEGPLSP